MPPYQKHDDEESQPLTEDSSATPLSTFSSPPARGSSSSTSTTSLVLEHINGNGHAYQKREDPYRDEDDMDDEATRLFEELDIEETHQRRPRAPSKNADAKYKRWLLVIGAACTVVWGVAFVLFLWTGAYKHRSTIAHDPDATAVVGTGSKITIDQLQSGEWIPHTQAISWIEGPNGEDGLLLERNRGDYLVVEDIRSRDEDASEAMSTVTLMKSSSFTVGTEFVNSIEVWPSPDLKHVLVLSNRQSNWRHSFTGRYWIFDVEAQTAEPLDHDNPTGRIQLAKWSPKSDTIVFTRDNNMFLRRLDGAVTPVTRNGGPEMFNGVPDWVYEEEVFSGNSATWWSRDGRYIAFLATNESAVPSFPVQYFLSRPSGKEPLPGQEYYPEVRQIKYPKAGAPNPVVHLRFYDVEKNEVFDVPIEDDFPDPDRLITEVLWGAEGQVLIRQTNRESDFLKMVLVDAVLRTGRIVRTQDVDALDGGWFEVSETTTFVPKNPANGREHDGYIDTVIHEGYDHLAYFTPLDNSEPKMLTSGRWEVVQAPSAIDLENNYVYFIATKKAPTQRHVYKVSLNGSDLSPLTNIAKDGYYAASFSHKAGFALISYKGPDIPSQKVISTPSNPTAYSQTIEENKGLAQLASRYEIPLKVYTAVKIDGYELNVVERRPPHFNPKKRYPVMFYLYGGPGSQTVDYQFRIDFQSYLASNLGYIVVTVDGRGTGYMGRATRCVIRGNLGYYEANDQIETAKIWGRKDYVDPTRMAIWGWSYGGYMTLKTLEQDAGSTFKYGMAVAPVTDWRFYDSIYTERWMGTPQHNPSGYHNSSIHNVTALGESVRFLLMHGVSDDNVHFQNSLTLLDNLDLAGVENYDVHVFPDSDHSIYFHNANRAVFDKLSWWLTNAFNGEWERLREVRPLKAGQQVGVPDGRRLGR